MTRSSKITWVGLTIVFICCLLPVGYDLVKILVNPDTYGVTVTAGSLEVIMPNARNPAGVFVSPTGRWLIFVTDEPEEWSILDTQTDQEQLLGYTAGDLRWVNEEEFAAGWRLVNATDLSVLELKIFPTPENNISALEILQGAERIYLLPTRVTGGIDVMSGDPNFPYGFDSFVAEVGQRPKGVRASEYTYNVLTNRFPETEFVVIKKEYFQPIAGIRDPEAWFDPNRLDDFLRRNDFPSPDGRFYARSASEREGTNLEIYQCGGKLVAHAVKEGWHIYPKGWAYDSSGFYFLLRPKVGWFSAGDQTISILKLNLSPEVLANAPPYEGEGFCE